MKRLRLFKIISESLAHWFSDEQSILELNSSFSKALMSLDDTFVLQDAHNPLIIFNGVLAYTLKDFYTSKIERNISQIFKENIECFFEDDDLIFSLNTGIAELLTYIREPIHLQGLHPVNMLLHATSSAIEEYFKQTSEQKNSPEAGTSRTVLYERL